MFDTILIAIQSNAALVLIAAIALWKHDARDRADMLRLELRLMKIETILGVNDDESH